MEPVLKNQAADGRDEISVYIHWPFCLAKCPYCDFNSHVRARLDQDGFRAALLREMDHYAAMLPGRRVTSVFFGGGTPSLMDPATVAALIERAAARWDLTEDAEITLEANPTSVEAEKFAGFRAAGVNRVSLGVQALRDGDLKFLGRAHDSAQAQAAIKLAARLFPRFSFDLIYARRGQTLTDWETELREALRMAGTHLSLYQLTVEQNTAFHTRAARGEVLTAGEDAAADLYDVTQAIMEDAGLPAYEISNHARPGHESRHNLTYWRYKDYIGLGAGAHGRFVGPQGRVATETHRVPEVWRDQVAAQSHGLRVWEKIDDPTAMREALMMGLRLRTGIDLAAWRAKFGVACDGWVPQDRLRRLIAEGLLAQDAEVLRATAAGMPKLNALLVWLLG